MQVVILYSQHGIYLESLKKKEQICCKEYSMSGKKVIYLHQGMQAPERP